MLLALTAALTIAPAVTVDRRAVTIGDLVRTADGRPLTGPTAALVALRLRIGQRQVVLPAETLAALVRRRAPTLVVTGSGSVTIVARSAAAIRPSGCWRSVRPMAAGATITFGDVAAAPCDISVVTVGRAPGSNALRLSASVPADAPLGRFVPAPTGHVATGTSLTLRSVRGPVAIERPVTTLQPGRSGRSVFVRDGAGQVFAAPLALVEQDR